MKKLTHEDVQKELNQMLVVFNAYCKKHDIKLALIGGTLLGAIRHQGFIPWDDDIDVFVMQDEHNKLVELSKENPYIDEEKRYKILAPGVYPNVYPYIKIIDTKTLLYEKDIDKKYATGLWLDVFMFTYYPDSLEESIKINKKQERLKLLNKIYIIGNVSTNKYKLIAVLLKPIKLIMNLLHIDCKYLNEKRLAMCTITKSNHIGNIVTNVGLKDRFPADYFKSYVKVKFENNEYYAPVEYDKLLTQFYGDYMTLPKEENRIIHDFEGYYLDDFNK